jgi:hypothetical protein
VAIRWTPEGKRRKGRPKTTWRRTVEKELQEIDHTCGKIEKITKNREDWKSLVLVLCASGYNKDLVGTMSGSFHVNQSFLVI